jgi:hypothetical protein
MQPGTPQITAGLGYPTGSARVVRYPTRTIGIDAQVWQRTMTMGEAKLTRG